MRITKRQLKKIIREAIGGPLPSGMSDYDWGFSEEEDLFMPLRDAVIDLGPDAENTFKHLVLDLNADPREIVNNFPSLASTLGKMDQQTLTDVAESL